MGGMEDWKYLCEGGGGDDCTQHWSSAAMNHIIHLMDVEDTIKDTGCLSVNVFFREFLKESPGAMTCSRSYVSTISLAVQGNGLYIYT